MLDLWDNKLDAFICKNFLSGDMTPKQMGERLNRSEAMIKNELTRLGFTVDVDRPETLAEIVQDWNEQPPATTAQSKPPNHNKPWTPEAKHELAHLFYEKGAQYHAIAEKIGRTKSSVVAQLTKLGALRPVKDCQNPGVVRHKARTYGQRWRNQCADAVDLRVMGSAATWSLEYISGYLNTPEYAIAKYLWDEGYSGNFWKESPTKDLTHIAYDDPDTGIYTAAADNVTIESDATTSATIQANEVWQYTDHTTVTGASDLVLKIREEHPEMVEYWNEKFTTSKLLMRQPTEMTHMLGCVTQRHVS